MLPTPFLSRSWSSLFVWQLDPGDATSVPKLLQQLPWLTQWSGVDEKQFPQLELLARQTTSPQTCHSLAFNFSSASSAGQCTVGTTSNILLAKYWPFNYPHQFSPSSAEKQACGNRLNSRPLLIKFFCRSIIQLVSIRLMVRLEVAPCRVDVYAVIKSLLIKVAPTNLKGQLYWVAEKSDRDFLWDGNRTTE